jgi:hypothetical protein
MVQESEIPSVLANASEDLAGNISGRFSPEDWDQILVRAKDQLRCSSKPLPEAWVDVIRDFHREKYWGFVPNYKVPKLKREDENLGLRFIWYSFRSFLLTKMAVVWFGALYSTYGDPFYKWMFFGAIAFMLSNYGLFLYRYGSKHKD